MFDGLIAMGTECLLPTEPLAMEVKNGYVTHILPSAHSDAVEAMLAKSSKQALSMGKEDYARNARGIGEVGLGLNPDAEMIPDMLEAEKVSGPATSYRLQLRQGPPGANIRYADASPSNHRRWQTSEGIHSIKNKILGMGSPPSPSILWFDL